MISFEPPPPPIAPPDELPPHPLTAMAINADNASNLLDLIIVLLGSPALAGEI
jgi:hypothetical protein